MTPVSIGLSFLGLVSLFWPLATLFCKRHVLNAQWLMMLSLVLFALTFFLLSSSFNIFLQGQYLLLIFFMLVVTISPSIIHIAFTILTQPKNKARKISTGRILLAISLLCTLLILISVLIAGPDNCRLWAANGLEGRSSQFIPGNWRYNLIVLIDFYFFWTLFTIQAFFLFFHGIRQLFRFRQLNSEYYSHDRYSTLNLKNLYIVANLGLLILASSHFTDPFSPDHLFIFIFTYCLPLGLIIFYIGFSVYRINISAERLPRRSCSRSRRDPAALAPQLIQYIEHQKNFLNPDLSVFLLAEHFHTSEDNIIDAIHYSQGTSFGDYIDNLRVQYALTLIISEHPDINNPDSITRIAHQSGYLASGTFEDAWLRVMHSSIRQTTIWG